jgi:uncharacterized membrane protein
MFGDWLVWVAIGLAFVLAGPVAFAMALANRNRVEDMRRRVSALELEISALRRARAAEAEHNGTDTQNAPMRGPAAPQTPVETRAPASPLPPPPPIRHMSEAPLHPPHAPSGTAGPRENFIERQFGGRAFVWLGGVALALAGFYLVKYSIETGLLTQDVRVALGIAFGLALLAGSQAVRARAGMADGKRIAQALAGAGIADLYGSLLAATSLYHLLPAWLGFGLMAAVTLAALILSLRHGAPIAALGLIGGYATPLMVAGEPNAPLLFAYLYLVFAGISVLVRRQNWEWLAIPATLIALAWVMLWLAEGLAMQDGRALSLFLLGIVATAVVATRGLQPSSTAFLWLRYVAPAGALILLAAVAYETRFGLFEWAMYGLLSAGAILLAWFEDRTYRFVPWLALLSNLAMLAGWQGAEPAQLAGTLLAFGVLFAASGQTLLPRSTCPLSWGGISAAAALGYFLLAYEKLGAALHAPFGRGADTAWTGIAVLLACGFAWATTRAAVQTCDTELRQRLQAVFAATATALLSVGFAIMLHQDYLPFAIAAELFALGWIATRVDIPVLHRIAAALAVLYAVLIIPDLIRLPGDIFDAWLPRRADSQWISTMRVLFRLALPGMLLGGASIELRKQADDEFVAALECGSLAALAIAVYTFVAIAFAGHTAGEALVVRSLTNDILLAIALAALWTSNRFARPAMLWSGAALGALVLARIALFDLAIFNPAWSHQWVGPVPIANALIQAYALPAALCALIAREFVAAKQDRPAWAAQIAVYVLALAFVALSVRQAFGGAWLDASAIGNAEVYTYSAVGLVCGVMLLFAAVLRKDRAMRVASLAVMFMTVGKVFLYDASALTGLWRVISFLGLGLCLLALSWFYSRFVFTTPSQSAPAAGT